MNDKITFTVRRFVGYEWSWVFWDLIPEYKEEEVTVDVSAYEDFRKRRIAAEEAE